jgi:cysteinyl-tRNA synthetase
MKKAYLILVIMIMIVPVNSTAQSMTWDDVGAWVYLLQDISVDGIKNANADLAVIDYSYDGGAESEIPLSDINDMKTGGHPKLIVSYMSIGEAEDYRFYWEDSWTDTPPSWLGEENPDWGGNYKVHYWEEEWKQIIYKSSNSYLDRIISAGFDGIYLDIIDGYEYYEETRSTARQDMIDFVIELADYAREFYPEFGIFPQNGDELLQDADYLDIVTGIGRENTYFADTDEEQDAEDTQAIEVNLDLLVKKGKLPLVVDYATKQDNIDFMYDTASSKDYIPNVTTIDLDELSPTYYDWLENDGESTGGFMDYNWRIGITSIAIVVPIIKFTNKKTKLD